MSNKDKKNLSRLSQSLFFLVVLIASAMSTQAQQLNPKFHYFIDGQAVQRGWSVGDPGNWSKSLDENGEGLSANGKLSVEKDDFQGKGDAIRGVWGKKKMRGVLGLYGNAVDLSEVEHRAALTFEIKVNKKPTRPVELTMDCGYPCGGKVQIRKTLQSAKKKQWFLMPIPLNCFSAEAENFDITKINGIFNLATDGKMDVSIANIRLELLPEGEKGCAAE